MASDSRLASILDDPLFLDKDPWNSLAFPIAPLHNPFPSHLLERPQAVEPTKLADVQHNSSNGLIKPTEYIPSTRRIELASTARHGGEKDGFEKPIQEAHTAYAGDSSSPPAKATASIKEVLNEDNISDNNGDAASSTRPSSSPRKRRRTGNSIPSEFVHLPKPPVVKNNHKAPRIPPLLQGLHEPPPDAGLFPPITETAFQDFLNPKTAQPQPLGERPGNPTSVQESSEKPGSVTRKRVHNSRRNKWSEEETRDLLRGVALFGIGRWKQILSFPELTFNNRSAIDLKDRFRVCCPKEYCKPAASATGAASDPENSGPKNETFSSPLSKILAPASPITVKADSASTGAKNKRPRRKTITDLSALGISAPFPRSSHRSRIAFTKEEDMAILRGFEKHGNQWRAIRNDPELCVLLGRTPTDLRDRLRTKFPDKYKAAGLKARPDEFPKPSERVGLRCEAGDSCSLTPTSNMSKQNMIDDSTAITTGMTQSGLQAASTTANTIPTTVEPSSLLLLQRPLAPFNLFSSSFQEFADVFYTAEGGTASYGNDDNDTATPVMLDRSIFDWADQNAPGGLSSATIMTAANTSTGTTNGAMPALPLEATHINPLATWKPASGLF